MMALDRGSAPGKETRESKTTENDLWPKRDKDHQWSGGDQ